MDKDIKIIPYVERNGSWTIPDHVVGAFFEQMEKDGTVAIVFNEKEVLTVKEFIDFLKDSFNKVFFVWTDRPCGVGWLNPENIGSFWANFCVLSHAWGDFAVKIGKDVLTYWYHFEKDGEPVIKSIMGVTPKTNKFAINFIEKIGGERIGVMPDMIFNAYRNQHIDGVLYYFRRNSDG